MPSPVLSGTILVLATDRNMTMKSKKKLRVVVIGAGDMANKVHYPSLASFEDVEIAAICDIDPKRLHETADKYAVGRRYADYRQMIQEIAPHGVYAIGQPHYMFDIWVWCLEQKQNLYIEKPMGLTQHQADVLADLAEKSGVITQVSHQRRTCPLLVKMREQCLSMGPITHAVCEFYKYQPAPMYRVIDHMMDDCVHSIDTLRWMCGGNVTSIESRCRRIGTPDINWIGATLHFDNGAIGYLINSWVSGRRVFRAEMHSPGIYVDVELEAKAMLYKQGDYAGVEFDTRQVAGSDENYVYGGFRAKHREFVDSLLQGTSLTSSPFSDCRKTMEVAAKVLAQACLA